LTDIRLEALSSAHQLEQLREAMNNMQDYLSQVDPTGSLGLTCDSLHTYQLNQGVQRTLGGGKPQVLPHQCLDNGPIQIFVTLKG
ncbi:hypothetical protein XENOCAPTIV_016592, partial [Xenoophorus captivus]